uniref:Uncharacterized protein n=1 Tax=Rhizophora mucronata TaxID=61149 RepID=A0A2P2IJ57_RHIMU
MWTGDIGEMDWYMDAYKANDLPNCKEGVHKQCW